MTLFDWIILAWTSAIPIVAVIGVRAAIRAERNLEKDERNTSSWTS